MVSGYRVGPDYIETHRVFVAADETGAVLGFYALLLDPPELDLMFVADSAQGRGIGRLLVAHMVAEAKAAGIEGRTRRRPSARRRLLSECRCPADRHVRARPPAVMWDRPELVIDTN